VSSEMGGRVGTPGVLLALSSPNKNEDLIV